MALLVRAKGITRVRSLEGGIDACSRTIPFVTEGLVQKPDVLREIFFAAADAAKFAISRWKLPVASDRVNFSQLSDD